MRCARSEESNDGAVVGLGDELLDSVGLESLDESLDLLAVLIACADCDYVCVGIGSFAVCILGSESVLSNTVACLKSVVAVDDGDGAFVTVLELCGNGVCLNSLNIIAVVVNDIENGNTLIKGSVLGQLDQAFLLEEEKCAGAVAVVSGDDDGCAFGNLGDAGNAVAVDAERLIVDDCCSECSLPLRERP